MPAHLGGGSFPSRKYMMIFCDFDGFPLFHSALFGWEFHGDFWVGTSLKQVDGWNSTLTFCSWLHLNDADSKTQI